MSLIPVRKFVKDSEPQIVYVNLDYITHIQNGNPGSVQIFFSSGNYIWAHESMEDITDKIQDYNEAA